jgi:arylsulfatase A-like enzyme
MPKINRRDFLKVASLAAGGTLLSNFATNPLWAAGNDLSLPNVIVILFDAMTARNLSVYGYRRQTTPNLERFAAQANVYHSHYSAGNFTTPGAASLLTGMIPWTHRAINLSGQVARSLTDRNIFRLLGGRYQRLAFSENVLVNFLLNQFADDIDRYLPPGAFSAAEQIIGTNFPGDLNTAYRAYDDFLTANDNPPGSLVFGLAQRLLLRREVALAQSAEYPEGLPRTSNYPIFIKLAEVFQGVRETIAGLSAPYFAYFHLWAPHAPYRPTKMFMGIFDDNWRPEKKPPHRFGNFIAPSHLNTRRLHYDEYVANVDAEFGKLLDFLKQSGVLENSYIVVTSDHGESFERGVDGHVTPLLYDPLLRIPLLIAAPGQKSRVDVYAPTISVDLLPTLLQLTGNPIPAWSEGRLLPGLGGSEEPNRSTFSVEAKSNSAFAPLTVATVAMRKNNFKLIYYRGYEKQDAFELYDLENDVEELDDLYPQKPSAARSLQEELLTRLDEANSNLRQ